MKQFILLLNLLFVIQQVSLGQGLSVNFSKDEYVFNKQLIKSGDKACLLINLLRKDVILSDPYSGNRPLVVFQIFDYVETTIKNDAQFHFPSFSNYINSVVLPGLAKDRVADISDLIQTSRSGVHPNLLDSILIWEEDKCFLLTGVIKVDFFNVLAYEQFHPLQVNVTIFNTKAMITPVHSWTLDSIPVFKADYIDKKIFLLKKDSADYYFYRFPERNEDSPLAFITGYTYRKDYGVIQLKSKYLQRSKSDKPHLNGILYGSPTYYTFR